MLFWNIGAEGQLVDGGFAAAGVALCPGGSWAPLYPCCWQMVVAGFCRRRAVGTCSRAAQGYLKVNEIITTLMLNYVAILWVQYLYYGPWKDPQGFGFPGTAQFGQRTWLPRLTGRVHLGLVFAILAAIFIWLVLGRTKWGYEIRLIGENPRPLATPASASRATSCW